MKTDITWRQTFFNILLEYYYKKVPEPEQVKVMTLEYQEDNNEIEAWLKDHISFNKGGVVELKNVCDQFYNKTFVTYILTTPGRVLFNKLIHSVVL